MREAGEQPMGPSLRGLFPILVVDVACPYLAYRLLTQYVPGISTTVALGLAGVFPAGGSVASLARRRRLDIIGAIVLTGIVVSIAAVLLGGDPKIVLIRESFVTGALGIVCLVSLLFQRPLLFYIGREFSTGNDPTRIAAFNDLWRFAGARHAFRLMTVVWGIGWVGEFLLRVLLVLTLTVGQVLIVSPIILHGITAALIVWTIYYARAARRRGEALRRAVG